MDPELGLLHFFPQAVPKRISALVCNIMFFTLFARIFWGFHLKSLKRLVKPASHGTHASNRDTSLFSEESV
jgi:hypothetical protein